MSNEHELTDEERAFLARELNLAAEIVAAWRPPQPGERHSSSAIPVSDEALATLLADARMAEVFAPCDVPDCENCNQHHLVWWDCCNALDRSTRIALQAWLNNKGYGLPDAPWEDVLLNGAPYRKREIGEKP